MNIGIIVGKFQAPILTEAHVAMIKYAISNYDVVYVFVGTESIKNRIYVIPYHINVSRISNIFNTHNKKVLYSISELRNLHNRTTWSAKLDSMINNLIDTMCINKSNITLIGGRDSYLRVYEGVHKNIDYIDASKIGVSEDISATNMIKKIIDEGVINNYHFLSGMFYANKTRYDISFQTVDICIFNSTMDMVLLGRKAHQSDFRFIGGFADPSSDSLEEDAIREVFEETTLKVNGTPKYVISIKVDDPRYVGTFDCIKTALFYVTVEDDNAVASDDIAEVKWYKLEDLNEDIFVKEHKKLYNKYKEYGVL